MDPTPFDGLRASPTPRNTSVGPQHRQGRHPDRRLTGCRRVARPSPRAAQTFSSGRTCSAHLDRLEIGVAQRALVEAGGGDRPKLPRSRFDRAQRRADRPLVLDQRLLDRRRQRQVADRRGVGTPTVRRCATVRSAKKKPLASRPPRVGRQQLAHPRARSNALTSSQSGRSGTRRAPPRRRAASLSRPSITIASLIEVTWRGRL